MCKGGVYTSTLVHVCVHVCLQAGCAPVYIHECEHACVGVHTSGHVSVCVYVYRQRCVCVCACVYEHGFGCGMATYRSLNLCHAPSLSFQTLPATLPQAASYSFLVYLSLLSTTLAGGPFTVSLPHFILMQGCEEGRDSSPICLRSGSLRPQT